MILPQSGAHLPVISLIGGLDLGGCSIECSSCDGVGPRIETDHPYQICCLSFSAIGILFSRVTNNRNVCLHLGVNIGGADRFAGIYAWACGII